MPTRSIIDIEVNDADFQRYAAAFAKYQDELKAQPAAWSDVAAASAAAAAAAAEMGVAVGAAYIATHKTSEESNNLTRNSRAQAGAWASMASNATKFTTRVIEATRSLLRWGELTGLISGILGAGGLFGIDRLAISAGNQRRNALGLGVTPGEAKAFEVDYGRVVDPQTMLSGVNQALHDVTKRVGLYGAGMTEDELRGKDTAQVSSELLTHLKKIADETPEAMMQNVLTARHLEQFINLQDFQRLKNTPAAEIQQYQRDFQRDTKDLELTNAQTRAWQDLQVQLHRAGAELENSLIRGLTALAGPIGNLSAAFTKLVEDVLNSKVLREWIDDLADGIKWLGDYINRTEFRQDVIDFMEGVNKMAHSVIDFVKNVGEVVGAIAGFTDRIKTFFSDPAGEAGKALGDSPLGGPDPDNDPRVPGSPAFNRERFGTSEGKSLLGGGGTWNQNEGDRAASQGWLKRQWEKLWGASEPAQEAPSATVQKQAFEQLEGHKGLPPGLLNAVMQTESHGDVNAVSPAGAVGGFQFMRGTADRYGVANRRDFFQSSRGASDYLRDLLKEFHGDLAKAAAGYNWGERNVEKAVEQYGDRWREHAPEETRDYVDKILRRTQQQNGQTEQANRRGLYVPNNGRSAAVAINVNNQTGGNSYISASQLAVG